jgi:hypothetical protein
MARSVLPTAACHHHRCRTSHSRQFDHRELAYRDLGSAAAETSATHGWVVRAGVLDLLPVAFIREWGAGPFATCDQDQFALAEAAGLKAELSR